MENLTSRQPENLTGLQVKLLQDLFEIGAVQFGHFKLKHHEEAVDASPSPVYIDLRLLARSPNARRSALLLYEELLGHLKFDIMAAVPEGVVPLVSCLMDDFGDMIIPRKNEKSHGLRGKIAGFKESDRGKTAVVIDDLITTSSSKLEAIGVLHDHDIKVKDVVVLIDREQGGRQELEKRRVKLHTGMTLTQMLDFYEHGGQITQETYKRVKEMIQNPRI